MTNTPDSSTVSVSRELLEQAIRREYPKPRLDGNYCCVGCGQWMPHDHDEPHDHLEGCPEEKAATEAHWPNRLRAILAQPADQQGDPVYQSRYPGGGWVDIKEDQREWASSLPHTEQRTLYRQAQPATAKVDERAEFEKWVQGTWGFPSTQLCLLSGPDLWKVWQARAKLNGESKVVLPELLNQPELEELEVIEAMLAGQGLHNLAGTMAAARQFIDEVAKLNGIEP